MNSFYKNTGKRLVDLVVSIPALITFFPIMLIVILLLLITGHRRLFFTQKRVGYQEKIFTLVKFCSMTDLRDKEGKLLPDAERLTKFGSLLRKTSLDELPQLINVIKGEMSLIGPRPLLIEYLPLYNEAQKKRHTVRPGITGWAQVNGRNAISWEKKFEYDTWYALHLSFLLDVRIIFLTVRNILRAEGVNQQGQATAEMFTGTKNQAV